MTAAGQTLNDRILAAKHSIAGQGLAKAVCKATTEEIIGPKKKHLDYLLHCTNEPNVSIPTLANLLIERTQNPNWVVVFKSLITTHHLMCYGNERFTQYLASTSGNFQLNGFLDKGGVQGYDMSPFIRRYAKYMSEKSKSYRNVAFDFCKVKRGKDGGTLRQMTGDKLVKTLPHLQAQIDALLEFDCSAQDLNNGVINACFMLLFRDLIRLFACYNDGIINLLEKYFEMNKKQAREALDIYKKFLICMDRVGEFLKVAENVGIAKDDIPDLAKAPSSLLEALEAHLASLEGRKPGSGGTTPTGNARMNVAAAMNQLTSASNAFGAASADVIDERTAAKLLQEEEAAMEKFRSTASASNPFAAPVSQGAEETPNILDLFGVAAPAAPAAAPPAAAPAAAAVPDAAAGKASDDLLQLSGNPFANMLNAAGNGSSAGGFGGGAPAQPTPFSAPSSGLFSLSNGGQFTNENAFNNVFGQTASTNGSNVLQPLGSTNTDNNSKMITGDLDSSLANLASNLNFNNQNRSGIVTQSRGPPMAGLNTMQSQPMSPDVIFSPPPTATAAATSSTVNGLTPSQSFPALTNPSLLTPSPSMPAMRSSITPSISSHNLAAFSSPSNPLMSPSAAPSSTPNPFLSSDLSSNQDTFGQDLFTNNNNNNSIGDKQQQMAAFSAFGSSSKIGGSLTPTAAPPNSPFPAFGGSSSSQTNGGVDPFAGLL